MSVFFVIKTKSVVKGFLCLFCVVQRRSMVEWYIVPAFVRFNKKSMFIGVSCQRVV